MTTQLVKLGGKFKGGEVTEITKVGVRVIRGRYTALYSKKEVEQIALRVRDDKKTEVCT